MQILIKRKNELSPKQIEDISNRIALDIHKYDIGPTTCWNTYVNGLYAAVDTREEVVGLIEASGPEHAVNPGWWIDSKCRGRGVGKLVVVELAKYLRANGYHGIGNIVIQTREGRYDEASRKLKSLFIETFKNG